MLKRQKGFDKYQKYVKILVTLTSDYGAVQKQPHNVTKREKLAKFYKKEKLINKNS